MSEDIYVRITMTELHRIAKEAGQAGAEAALKSLSPRLDHILDAIELSAGLKPVMTTREAADYAGVQPGTILTWIKGGLKAEQRGGSAGYAILRDDIDDWRLSGGTTQGPRAPIPGHRAERLPPRPGRTKTDSAR